MVVPGAYERRSMKLVLPVRWHHNPSTLLRKCFPYKKSEILLFEAVHGMHVMTKQQWQRISLSCRVQLRIPRQFLTPFLPKGYNCPYFNYLLHIIVFYLTQGFCFDYTKPANYVYRFSDIVM